MNVISCLRPNINRDWIKFEHLLARYSQLVCHGNDKALELVRFHNTTVRLISHLMLYTEQEYQVSVVYRCSMARRSRTTASIALARGIEPIPVAR